MVKIAGTNQDGRPVMIFGLSQLNLTRLKEGKPIAFDAGQVGLPFDGEILIFYGHTEHDMLEDLSQHLGPDTKVSIDPRSL